MFNVYHGDCMHCVCMIFVLRSHLFTFLCKISHTLSCPLSLHEFTWYVFVWVCMGLHGFAWVCMGLHGFASVCMGLHRFASVCMDEFRRVCMSSYTFAYACSNKMYTWVCISLYWALYVFAYARIYFYVGVYTIHLHEFACIWMCLQVFLHVSMILCAWFTYVSSQCVCIFVKIASCMYLYKMIRTYFHVFLFVSNYLHVFAYFVWYLHKHVWVCLSLYKYLYIIFDGSKIDVKLNSF